MPYRMVSLTVDLYSSVLGQEVRVKVILPEPTGDSPNAGGEQVTRPEHGWPTLWLLHGLSDNEAAWTRRTAIERYAAGRGLAIVMPGVGRSFYTDMHRGPNYFTFVTDELPALCRELFRLSDRRADNFVAGLSMGGYGAMKVALTYPDRYAAAASLSGAVDTAHRVAKLKPPYDAWQTEMLSLIYGQTDIEGTPVDIRHLATRAHALGPDKRPALFLACGTDDFLYPDHLAMTEHLDSLDYPALVETHPGRDHDWGYWDFTIQHVLDWLPVAARGKDRD